MIQQNMAIAQPGQLAACGPTQRDGTLTLQQMMSRLELISTSGGENAQLANQMLGLLNRGDRVSPALLQSLGTLLQSSDGDTLNAGLNKLLASLTQGGRDAKSAVKALGNLLIGQIVEPSTRPGGKTSSLLRQLSRGNLSAQTSRQLQQALQQLRGSGLLVNQHDVSEQLQEVLRQVQQELGQGKDAAMAKPLTEFAVRLNQQLSANAAFQESACHVVHERQGQGQQQNSGQQQDNDDDPVEQIDASRKKKVEFPFYKAGYSSAGEVNAGRQATGLPGITISTSNSSVSSILNGDSVFTYGLSVLYLFMQMLSDQANSQYAGMESNSTISREAQSYASQVDSVLADVSGSDNKNATGKLSEEVMSYLEDNHMEIDGVCGYGSDGVWAWNKDPSNGFNKGDLTAIKGALDNVANRASDFISTAQLQLQKVMQTYNVCSSLINSMQTLLADMNKTIAQGIR
ncbi:hypothetical protein MUA02_01130 [Enterobacteriaceae bacterium H20N1]|uniref:Uncharacterized protein n=2 Tax=Dryocola boscaweniae TaxID=2925397 RepID=A0A9X2W4E5_9ENTR|nr:hypothetical protein [Dryocola boscaweniae]MCT4700510.1 hypothetical protein [Dryocola boscaweniae]MCT4717666.1 hypothetical protein [Dryocola boscaweniae]